MRPRITCTWLLLPRDPTKNLGKKLPLFPYGIPKLGAHSRSSIHLLKVTPNVRPCWLLALLLSVLLSRWDLPPATLQPLTGAFRVLAFIYCFRREADWMLGRFTSLAAYASVLFWQCNQWRCFVAAASSRFLEERVHLDATLTDAQVFICPA